MYYRAEIYTESVGRPAEVITGSRPGSDESLGSPRIYLVALNCFTAVD